MISDSNGNLFGTAWGNALESPYGTVFELSPPVRGGEWRLTTLHKFPGNFDTAQPKGRLMRNRAGAIFGATSSISGKGDEVVFKVIP